MAVEYNGEIFSKGNVRNETLVITGTGSNVVRPRTGDRLTEPYGPDVLIHQDQGSRSRHMESSEKSLLSQESRKLSLSDSDSMLLPPSAMADLLEDDFLTPLTKSTQIQPEPSGVKKSRLDGDIGADIGGGADNFSSLEGAKSNKGDPGNLADVSPVDQVKAKSSDLGGAYTAMANSKELSHCRIQLLKPTFPPKVQELPLPSDKGIDENITAVQWSKGLAVQTAAGPAQVRVHPFPVLQYYIV